MAASWRTPSLFVRRVRPMQKRSGRSQNVSPPSIVAGAGPGLDRRGLREPVRLARPERDRPSVGDEERVVGVDEVGAGDLRLEDVDADAERRQELGEGVVLALREPEIAGVEEPVPGVVEGGPERRPGPLHEDVVERRRHALRPVGAAGHRRRRHERRIRSGRVAQHAE
jgi:hypothetical protein